MTNKELKELQNEFKEKERILKREIKITTEFKKLNIEINNILNLDTHYKEKPLITIEIKDLKELKHILKHFKPLPLYYIDNTTTTDLKPYEKQKITLNDGSIINSVEYQKQRDHFFKIHNNICLNFENSRHIEKIIKLKFESDKYEFWVSFSQDLINSKYLDYTTEIDVYETEQARNYNPRHKEITKDNYFLKENGTKKMDFYGGSKKVFAINKTGSDYIKKVLNL